MHLLVRPAASVLRIGGRTRVITCHTSQVAVSSLLSLRASGDPPSARCSNCDLRLAPSARPYLAADTHQPPLLLSNEKENENDNDRSKIHRSFLQLTGLGKRAQSTRRNYPNSDPNLDLVANLDLHQLGPLIPVSTTPRLLPRHAYHVVQLSH